MALGKTLRAAPRRLFKVEEFVVKELPTSRVLRHTMSFDTLVDTVFVEDKMALKCERRPLECANTVQLGGAGKAERLESPMMTLPWHSSKRLGGARVAGDPKRSSWTTEEVGVAQTVVFVIVEGVAGTLKAALEVVITSMAVDVGI